MEQTTGLKGAWTPNDIAEIVINALQKEMPADADMYDPDYYAPLLLGFSKIIAGVVSQLPLTRKGRNLTLGSTIDILRKYYEELADKVDAQRKLN